MTDVTFHSAKGTRMPATLIEQKGGKATIQIEGDPFPVEVKKSQITIRNKKGKAMPKTKSKGPTAKELRNKAKEYGIADYEDMTKAELQEAVESFEEEEVDEEAPKKKAAKKTTKSKAKKTTAKKGSKKTADAEENGVNPFRPNTNLYHVTEALMEGGKRSALVKKLRNKVEFNPRKQDAEDMDVDEEIDRRLKVVGYILKNQHGFELEHEGRGKDAFIKATPGS